MLHHLNDPMVGWRVLVSLMEADGLMRIALYSEKARSPYAATREFQFRDLVMHVQEHRFTLPQIAECLDQLGLRFLRLECAPATLNRFKEMFPQGDSQTDLDAWDRFETAHPDTFMGMYLFWCCRK